MKIKAIYDNGGRTADQYTVMFEDESALSRTVSAPIQVMFFGTTSPPRNYPALLLSRDCNMPNGVNMWGEAAWRPSESKISPTLGKRIKFSQLPRNVQRCVKAQMAVL